jgi:S-adenosylmethionine hydrolase
VAGVVATYADIRPGEVCALFGSTDHLECAINGGSAAARLAVGRGAPVEVTRI